MMFPEWLQGLTNVDGGAYGQGYGFLMDDPGQLAALRRHAADVMANLDAQDHPVVPARGLDPNVLSQTGASELDLGPGSEYWEPYSPEEKVRHAYADAMATLLQKAAEVQDPNVAYAKLGYLTSDMPKMLGVGAQLGALDGMGSPAPAQPAQAQPAATQDPKQAYLSAIAVLVHNGKPIPDELLVKAMSAGVSASEISALRKAVGPGKKEKPNTTMLKWLQQFSSAAIDPLKMQYLVPRDAGMSPRDFSTFATRLNTAAAAGDIQTLKALGAQAVKFGILTQSQLDELIREAAAVHGRSVSQPSGQQPANPFAALLGK